MHELSCSPPARPRGATFFFPLMALFGGALLTGSSASAEQPQAPQKLSLTLSQAVELALKNNLRTRLAEERVAQSRAEKSRGRSALLPNLSGVAYQLNLTENLAAMGLPIGEFPGLPAMVGPFSRFDARFQLMQSVFDLASIRRFQAASQGVGLAGDEHRLAAQQVMTATALAYLAVLEAEQSVAAAEANVLQAERLLDLARSQREAGVATGVDVARAETRLANQRVQLAQARTSLDTARLTLLRVVGAPLSSPVVLAESMRFAPEPRPDMEKAVAQALSDRLDLQVVKDQVRVAQAARKAATAEWLPSVSLVGDYGSSGLRPREVSLPTRSIGLRLDVPLFNGGRTRSEVQMASSLERQAEMQLSDLRAAVEKDVRLSLENLATREEQVRAAQTALGLAQRELELAQDRFRNGVADNMEVVNAQTALENARQVLVASLAQFNVARLNLASALGHVEDFRL
jgi:outer membrane protein